MKARFFGDCMVCGWDILPGDEIRRAPGIGWVHDACCQKLDQPISQDDQFREGLGPESKLTTYRQLAEYNIKQRQIDQDDARYDDWDEGPAPIDADDMWGYGW